MKATNGSTAESRSLVVLNWLVEGIRTDTFREDEKLPTERELAEELQVGRSSVREALSILSALGVVRRLAGVGPHVASASATLLNRAVEIAEQGGDLREIYELQRVLAVGISELAARRMTPECLVEVDAAYAAMNEAVATDDIDRYFIANRSFHLAIVRSARNSLLEQEVLRLLHLMERPLWRAIKQYLMAHQSDYLKASLVEQARASQRVSHQRHRQCTPRHGRALRADQT